MRPLTDDEVALRAALLAHMASHQDQLGDAFTFINAALSRVLDAPEDEAGFHLVYEAILHLMVRTLSTAHQGEDGAPDGIVLQ